MQRTCFDFDVVTGPSSPRLEQGSKAGLGDSEPAPGGSEEGGEGKITETEREAARIGSAPDRPR